MRVSAAVAFLALLGLPLSAQQAQSAPVASAAAPAAPDPGAAIAEKLRASLSSLGDAVASLQPDQFNIPDAEKQALADSQTSIRRNLREAMPALITGFESSPENIGAAFRLYRDADVVVTVAQRSAELLPREDSDSAKPVESNAAAVSRDLDQLGNWIETRGQSDYTRLRQLAAAPPPPKQPATPPPPSTLVIGNANGPTKAAAKTKIPH